MAEIVIVEANTPDMQAAAPGFADVLRTLDPAITWRTVQPFAAPVTTCDFSGADGIVFTGSGTPWATNAPEVACQRAAMELALGTGIPTWGSCNGMQLAAEVLGAKGAASPNGMEVPAARDIRLTEAGRAHPMMAGRRDGFSAPSIHRDEVQTLPQGATCLAGNDHSPVQAFAIATGGIDFWGTQYHPELSARDLAAYIRANGIFGAHDALLPDLDRADSDLAAATRLGFGLDDLVPETRTTELANWLAHIKQRAKT